MDWCFLTMGEYFYALLAFATLGVLVPFFYYNVFGDPAKRTKIFMGDTGSLDDWYDDLHFKSEIA